ncbi:unnamed protein product [Brassicogethes aeneus]|uniref:WD repeat-containing protein 13 n=1 Tax=Brassicogethes aeneus TaxID=1431903 RepID=A0A9P0FBN7_BRAAE|nr:unnamed protein product [Brassicogethes aeneus]
MTSAVQQQIFALDARFNAHRAPQSPSFRTLYIRRRSQLLRESGLSPDDCKQYLKLRTFLLQQRYGNPPSSNASDTLSRASIQFPQSRSNGSVVPTKEAEASRAMVGGNSIADNYAFVGVHHIFDQHTQPVTMIKFANNDKSRLCCCSIDGNLSICDVTSEPPTVSAILKGHSRPITGIDWSVNNDLIVSSSMDSTIRVWNVSDYTCLRIINDPNKAQILCCIFQPSNNNLLLTGNSRGELRIANVSTGRFMKNVCKIGGNLLCLTSDNNGKIMWAGNDKGEIYSVFCELNGGLCKTKKVILGSPCSITSLSYRAWISREARNPMLLVNATNNSLLLFSITDSEGALQIKRQFQNRQLRHMVKSTFCPIMSFRQGACVVTGSEDGSIYFLDIEKTGSKSVVNTLQGHAAAVLGVSFNYDESLLATSDLQGLVIIWKKGNI